MKHYRFAALLLAGTTACAAAQDYPSLVQSHHLLETDQTLSSLFPRNQSGEACARLLTLLPFRAAESYPDEASQIDSELNLLRAHPGEAIASIAAGLQVLPDRYAGERQYLVQFAGRLDADNAAKIGLLSDELARPYRASADPHDHQAFYDGAIALDSLLELTRDPKVVHPALRKAFAANPSEVWRGLLLSRYDAIDPQGARAFRLAAGIPQT